MCCAHMLLCARSIPGILLCLIDIDRTLLVSYKKARVCEVRMGSPLLSILSISSAMGGYRYHTMISTVLLLKIRHSVRVDSRDRAMLKAASLSYDRFQICRSTVAFANTMQVYGVFWETGDVVLQCNVELRIHWRFCRTFWLLTGKSTPFAQLQERSRHLRERRSAQSGIDNRSSTSLLPPAESIQAPGIYRMQEHLLYNPSIK